MLGDERVVRRCEELHLDSEETKLLLDLLGWNIGKTGQVPPLSHRGLKIYGGLPWYEPETSDRITALCEKVLGDRLPECEENPDAFFYDHYTHREFSRGVGALLWQLDLVTASDKDYTQLLYLAPELVYRSFMKILSHFLDPKS